MKRYGNLYDKFCTKENFEQAHANASRHKTKKNYVVNFNTDRNGNIDNLLESHRSGTFEVTKCSYKTVQDKRKKRVLTIRPYNPDKVTQHGVINVVAPIWRASFTRDTYSNMKDHGLHQCVRQLQMDLHADPDGTKYCLQIDLVQHYPNMSHDVMKKSVRRKVKDERLVGLIDCFIDSMDGLSLGDPMSGWIENMVMTPFDHKVKEKYGIKHYYRFQDDMLFFSNNKAMLHELHHHIVEDMSALGQRVKGTWQIYLVDARGVDFLGYRFFHGYTMVRKSIKRGIFRLIAKYGRGEVSEEVFRKSLPSRMGWLDWSDSYRLKEKIKQEIDKAEKKRRKELKHENAIRQQTTAD